MSPLNIKNIKRNTNINNSLRNTNHITFSSEKSYEYNSNNENINIKLNFDNSSKNYNTDNYNKNNSNNNKFFNRNYVHSKTVKLKKNDLINNYKRNNSLFLKKIDNSNFNSIFIQKILNIMEKNNNKNIIKLYFQKWIKISKNIKENINKCNKINNLLKVLIIKKDNKNKNNFINNKFNQFKEKTFQIKLNNSIELFLLLKKYKNSIIKIIFFKLKKPISSIKIKNIIKNYSNLFIFNILKKNYNFNLSLDILFELFPKFEKIHNKFDLKKSFYKWKYKCDFDYLDKIILIQKEIKKFLINKIHFYSIDDFINKFLKKYLHKKQKKIEWIQLKILRKWRRKVKLKIILTKIFIIQRAIKKYLIKNKKIKYFNLKNLLNKIYHNKKNQNLIFVFQKLNKKRLKCLLKEIIIKKENKINKNLKQNLILFKKKIKLININEKSKIIQKFLRLHLISKKLNNLITKKKKNTFKLLKEMNKISALKNINFIIEYHILLNHIKKWKFKNNRILIMNNFIKNLVKSKNYLLNINKENFINQIYFLYYYKIFNKMFIKFDKLKKKKLKKYLKNIQYYCVPQKTKNISYSSLKPNLIQIKFKKNNKIIIKNNLNFTKNFILIPYLTKNLNKIFNIRLFSIINDLILYSNKKYFIQQNKNYIFKQIYQTKKIFYYKIKEIANFPYYKIFTKLITNNLCNILNKCHRLYHLLYLFKLTFMHITIASYKFKKKSLKAWYVYVHLKLMQIKKMKLMYDNYLNTYINLSKDLFDNNHPNEKSVQNNFVDFLNNINAWESPSPTKFEKKNNV